MKRTAFLLFLLALGLAYFYRHPLERALFEKITNTAAREYFNGSVRLKSAVLDKETKLHVRHATGTLQSEGGPVALEIRAMDSEKLIPDVLSEGSVLTFEGLRPAGSQNPGLKGRAEVKAGAAWSYASELEIEGLDLSEIRWLNPENLKGSAGMLKGRLKVSAEAVNPEPRFEAVLLADSGGTLQARFFEVLLPYLPAMPTQQKMKQLADSGEVVKFKDAALRVETAAANKLKVALHILIPDYNVELNIGLEIRIEEQTSFYELAQLLGFLKVKS